MTDKLAVSWQVPCGERQREWSCRNTIQGTRAVLGVSIATTLVLFLFLGTGHILIPNNKPQQYLWQYRDSPETKDWKPRKVLLFTHARSGSSFTGDIIYHSPNVYYVFEPLRHVFRRNDTPDHRTRKSLAVLQAFFTCNFTASFLPHLDPSFLKKNAETRMLNWCLDYRGDPRKSLQLTRCLRKAEAVCRTHSEVVIKTIRLTIAEVERLMTLNSDLAVIFLVRDPRASTWSRMNVFGRPKKEDLPTYAEAYGEKLKTDLLNARRLFALNPAKLRFIRYEDLADNPVHVVRNIYRFLRLNWTEDIERETVAQTGSSDKTAASTNSSVRTAPRKKVKGYAYSVKRDNSSAAASRWREEMPFSISRIVEQSCSEMMTLLGYRKFETEQALRDFNLPSRGRFQYVEDLPLPGANLG